MSEALHLSYHYITFPGEEPAGPRCAIQRFEAQMDYLRDNKYQVLSCSEVVRRMKGNLPLPDKVATLSFDDNLRDGYTKAYLVLRRYGYPGAFLVITSTLRGRIPPVIKIQMLAGKLGGLELQRVLTEKLKGSAYESLMGPDYDMTGKKMGEKNPDNRRPYWVFCHILPLSLQVDLADEMFDEYFGADEEKKLHSQMFIQPDELCQMSRCGMEISSHTVNHPLLSTCGVSDVEKEAVQSRDELRELLGGKPDIEIFGWPFGGVFSKKVIAAVAKYYDGAYNFVNAPTMPQGPYDPYDIPRLDEAGVACFTHLA